MPNYIQRFSNEITLPQTTYLFVDGANFRRDFDKTTSQWFGQRVEFDFERIRSHFNADRVFYYDCIDGIKNDNELEEEFKNRVSLQAESLDRIREIDGCHVHFGTTTGRGKNKRQKEVDVLLAVEMMEHAFRKNMDRAVLLSGDKDFRPLVESLVRLGLHIEVVGDKKSMSRDLIHAADKSIKLTFDDYYKWTTRVHRDLRPLSVIFHNNMGENPPRRETREGVCMECPLTLLVAVEGRKHRVWLNLESKGGGFLVADCDNLEDIDDYFELQYGKIDWNNAEAV
jgi:uncharacterized LabA/DUF88 family protein